MFSSATLLRRAAYASLVILLCALAGIAVNLPRAVMATSDGLAAVPGVTFSNTSDVLFEIVGHLDASADVSAVAISGDLAYLGEWARDQQDSRVITSTLTIVDVSTPTLPLRRGSLPISNEPIYQIQAAGSYAYISSAGMLHTIDVSNPDTPALTGTYNPPPDNFYSRGSVGSVQAVGNLVYALVRLFPGTSCCPQVGMDIIDVATPSQPRLLNRAGGGYAISFHVDGNRAYLGYSLYVGPGYPPGLKIWDIHNPLMITEIGSMLDHYTIPWVRANNNLAYVYNQEWTYDHSSPNFSIFDVNNPLMPTLLGQLSMPYPGMATLAGQQVYAAGGNGSAVQLQAIDVSDPYRPLLRGGLTIPAASYSADVAAANGLVYLAAGPAGLYILRPNYVLQGRIVDVNGTPIPGVTVTTVGGLQGISDASGIYTILTTITGSYTLTPTLAVWVFDPPATTLTVPSADGRRQWANFTILPPPVTTIVASGAATSLIYTDTQGLPVRFDVSPNTFAQTTVLTVIPTTGQAEPDLTFAGHAFTLTVTAGGSPTNTEFSAPLTVTLRYSATDVRLVSDKSQIALRWWTGNAWADAATTCSPATTYSRNLATNEISVPICRSGYFVLRGPTNYHYLPLVFK